MKLHKIPGYIQVIYLVEYPDKLMLLDGCSRADVGTVKRYIETHLGRPFSDLKVTVVTHMHPDHAGAAHKLREITGCQVVSANVSGHWYKGIDGKLMHLTDIMLASWVAGRLNKPRKLIWYSSKLKPDYKLNDGETIPGFEDWQVLFTQGHTDRDLTLYHQATSYAYVADLMVSVKGKFIPPYPVFYPNRYKQSIKKLKALAVERTLLAHGGEVELTDADFEYLLANAPDKPTTHWRSVKNKLVKSLGFGINN